MNLFSVIVPLFVFMTFSNNGSFLKRTIISMNILSNHAFPVFIFKIKSTTEEVSLRFLPK